MNHVNGTPNVLPCSSLPTQQTATTDRSSRRQFGLVGPHRPTPNRHHSHHSSLRRVPTPQQLQQKQLILSLVVSFLAPLPFLFLIAPLARPSAYSSHALWSAACGYSSCFCPHAPRSATCLLFLRITPTTFLVFPRSALCHLPIIIAPLALPHEYSPRALLPVLFHLPIISVLRAPLLNVYLLFSHLHLRFYPPRHCLLMATRTPQHHPLYSFLLLVPCSSRPTPLYTVTITASGKSPIVTI